MDRNKVQKKNITLGGIFKGISIFLNFILVPILIGFLGKLEYGVWITVFSIMNWIFTFDMGIGQGLRNKLTEALSNGELKKANTLVSTSYLLIALLSVIILCIGLISLFSVNFQTVLNYSQKSNTYLQNFIFLALFFTTINFVLSLYKKLYLAIHKSYLVEVINVLFQMFFISVLLIWVYLDINKSLINLIIIFGITNVLISIYATYYFFKINKIISISYRYFDLSACKSLLRLGGKFFIINVSLLIILSTDNIIISNMLGPSYVTDYSTIQKVFQFLIVGFTVVLSSSWSLYSEAISRKDYKWIRENLMTMNTYFLVIAAMGCILYYFLEEILSIWIGKDLINIPKGLALSNLIYALIFSYTNIYMFFINASNKISLQMYLYVFGALLNIPLSIYLVQELGSSSGVMISTIICFLPLFIMMPIQTKIILKKSNTIE